MVFANDNVMDDRVGLDKILKAIFCRDNKYENEFLLCLLQLEIFFSFWTVTRPYGICG